MASRAVGALFGLAAAILFAASIASPVVTAKLPAWWDGHPIVEGKTYDRMDVHVGLAAAARCFDGDANCSPLDVDSTFTDVALGELGVAGLAAMFVVLMTISIWRLGERRKMLAQLALGVTIIAGAGSAALVLIGPDLHATDQGRSLAIGVPIGPGLFMFWGALTATIISATSALRVQPEPLRLKPSLARPPETVQPDLREIMREQHDSLRPSAMGPEPMIGAPASPGRGVPLFDGAPQLRPLYDVQGAAPVPPPVQMPSRAPTPMPAASMRALAGIDTPPPAPPTPRSLEHQPAPRRASDRAESQPIDPPPPAPPPLRVPTMPDGPLKPKTPLPPRAKPPSAAPPPTPRASQPNIGRATPGAGEKPIGRKTPLAGEKPIGRKSEPATAQKVGRKSEPVFARKSDPAIPERVPEKKTIAHAVPPMPTPDDLPAPTTLAAKDARLGTDVDSRLETGMRETEAITAVEIDAEAKAAFVAAERQRKLAERHAAETAQMIDGSDTGVEVAPPTRMASTTSVSVVEAAAPPRMPSTTSVSVVNAAEEPTPHTDPATPAIPAAEEPRAPTPIPISTAPTSLPPPKAAPTMPSGPTPACPQCEAPMAWVEEHLRFYCKQCRMYF
jgi:hypothetical protein